MRPPRDRSHRTGDAVRVKSLWRHVGVCSPGRLPGEVNTETPSLGRKGGGCIVGHSGGEG